MKLDIFKLKYKSSGTYILNYLKKPYAPIVIICAANDINAGIRYGYLNKVATCVTLCVTPEPPLSPVAGVLSSFKTKSSTYD